MEKSKIGVNISLISALIYFVAIFGGYTPLILLAGYTFLIEKNEKLQDDVINAFTIMITYSIFYTIINYVPDVFNWISTLTKYVSIKINFSNLNSVIRIIADILILIKTLILISLGIKSYKSNY